MIIPADPPPDGSVITANVTDSTGEPVVAAGGSGFVVYPNYVLTTRQLAKNAREFQIASAEQSEKR